MGCAGSSARRLSVADDAERSASVECGLSNKLIGDQVHELVGRFRVTIRPFSPRSLGGEKPAAKTAKIGKNARVRVIAIQSSRSRFPLLLHDADSALRLALVRTEAQVIARILHRSCNDSPRPATNQLTNEFNELETSKSQEYEDSRQLLLPDAP